MNRRALLVIVAVLFAGMCVLIAWGQWYAVHVNVPRLTRQVPARKAAPRPHAPACVAPPAKTAQPP